ncbi:MAG: PQQ-binding-like beta-propeller repeat protein [Bacteroidetes bacterium]|nr:PQQ-binding-like beta-propeller repeat protein [Bacteroidota bacterium]
MPKTYSAFFFLFAVIIFSACKNEEKKSYTGWRSYGGGNENIHYSSLTEIDTNNVQQLKPVWEYHTNDVDTANHSQIQCNPIMIDGIVYGTSPKMRLFAIDAATGKEKWVFNPFDSLAGNKMAFFVLNNCRGVSYWTDGNQDKRIFYTAGSWLYAVDATSGKQIISFGDSGKIDLHDGLDRNVKDLFVTSTTPPAVYKDLLIMGTRVDEGPAAAPGHIRAFDTRTGKLRWIFHTIPHPGEAGYESWDDTTAYKHIGGANAWSGIIVDEKRGIVYASTGSASFDFYGGKRTGNDLYADCLLALDANTGKRIWHFQDVHHDIWDRDFSSPGMLVTVTNSGKQIDAIATTTKTGFVFVFNRETGEPVFPITETPVPTETSLVGEKVAPTQPIPSLPKPFVRQSFTEKDINHLLPDSSYEDIRKKLASYKTGIMFNPPSTQGTVIFPGFDGGGEWGGPSFDPETGLLYVNANEMPWVLTMVALKQDSKKQETFLEAGQRLYKANCMSCHGTDRKGSGNFPSLINIEKKYKEDSFNFLVSSGRRMMPAFKQLTADERGAIASFVLSIKKNQNNKFVEVPNPEDAWRKLPYSITGYNKFLSKEGYPAIAPPWGTLNAINLNTGELSWKDTLGNYPEFAAKGIQTGTENYGGSVITKGGLLFIGASRDGKFRAYNKRTGKLLFESTLPAPAFATPAVFEHNGKEFIVIACGGGKLNTTSGDSYVAFALP